MKNIRLVVGVVAVSIFSSCGAVEGARCQPENGGVCDGADGVLICEVGTFTRYPCFGASGCTTNQVTKAFLCDFTGANVGQRCPKIAVDTIGFCENATTFVKCDGATRLWTARACSSCTTSGGAAKCNP